jgi:tetratricopeptide (TPR) repeat protein
MARRRGRTAAVAGRLQPSGGARRPEGLRLLPQVAIVFAGLITYSNTLHNPFVLDDLGSVVRNPGITQLWSWDTVMPMADMPTSGRPLVNLSLAINYAMGGLDVRGYHAVNIGLHVLCGLLLFALARRLVSVGMATAIALLWTVHPLNSEVVNYITQRTESMMAACLLLTLYASSVQGPARSRWQIVAVLACAAGMACKETMVVAPLAVLLYDAVYMSGSAAAAIRARPGFYACLLATWVPLAALVATGGQDITGGFTFARPQVWPYFIYQGVMITEYLRLALWPSSLVAYYGWTPAVTLAHVWPAFTFVTALFLATLVALWKRPRVGALGAWVFLTLGPMSSVLPIVAEVGAERRMYLPLMSIVALVVLGAAWVWERRGAAGSRAGAVPVAAVTIVAIALGATTVARNREFSSGLVLAETILARWPTPNAHQLVGSELAAVGRNDEAIAHLREAAPAFPMARYYLGEVLLRMGRAGEAIPALESFLPEAPPNNVRNTHLLLAQAYGAMNQPARAIDHLKAVVALAPGEAAVHALLADALSGGQAFAEAIPHYQAFLRSNPRNTNALTGLGVALIATGKAGEAVVAFRGAVDVDPRNSRFRQNLARALLETGAAADALAEAQQAVTLDARDPASFEVLGLALARVGRVADARLSFQRALQLDPTYAPAAAALRALGRQELFLQ